MTLPLTEAEMERRVDLLQEVFDLQARHNRTLAGCDKDNETERRLELLDHELETVLAELLPLMEIEPNTE